MHGESGDDVGPERNDPQDGAFSKTFAKRPKRRQGGHEKSGNSTNTRLYMDDEPHGQPHVCSHERGEAENQEGRDDEVLAGHARERSAQRADLLPLR